MGFQVLRYEVRNVAAPLVLESYWKCELAHTDLRVDYRLNPDCPLECALLNLTFVTKINGKVSKTIAKPEADWLVVAFIVSFPIQLFSTKITFLKCNLNSAQVGLRKL